MNFDTEIAQRIKAKGQPEQAPCAIEAQDALDACRRCLGVLYCALEVSGRVDPDDVAGALGLAVAQLDVNLRTVRDHFGMDE